DGVARKPRLDREDVLEGDAALARDDGAEAVGGRAVAVGGELLREPGRRLLVTLATGDAARVEARELPGRLNRRGAVEGGGQGRCGQRRRPPDAEGGDEHRQADEEPGAPVEAAVERTLDRAAARSDSLG